MAAAPNGGCAEWSIEASPNGSFALWLMVDGRSEATTINHTPEAPYAGGAIRRRRHTPEAPYAGGAIRRRRHTPEAPLTIRRGRYPPHRFQLSRKILFIRFRTANPLAAEVALV